MSKIYVFYNNQNRQLRQLTPVLKPDTGKPTYPNSCYLLIEKSYRSGSSQWNDDLVGSNFYFLNNRVNKEQADIINSVASNIFKTINIPDTDEYIVLFHMRPTRDTIYDKSELHFSPLLYTEETYYNRVNSFPLVEDGSSVVLNFLSAIIVGSLDQEPVILHQSNFTELSLRPGHKWTLITNGGTSGKLPQLDLLFGNGYSRAYGQIDSDLSSKFSYQIDEKAKITLTFTQNVTLDQIYQAIVHTVAYNLQCTAMFFKEDYQTVGAYVNQNHTNTLEIIQDHVRIVLENGATILPGKNISTLKYNFWKGLNISPDVNIEFQNKVLLRYMSSAKFNALVKIYEDKECTVQLGTVYQTETTSLNFHVPRNGGFKIAAWSLGNASYYASNQNIAVTRGSATSIPWNPYANDVLNLNAINSVLPIMNTINSVVTPTGIELQLPAIRLNSDEAKMALHLLSSSREGLEASMSGDGEYISRINTDRFTIFAPSFTVVKKPNLRADQQVYIDLYIDTVNAIKLNPEYVVNPYRANGRVELPAAPAITRNPAQEIVDTLLKHPQFVSNTTMTLALDK